MSMTDSRDSKVFVSYSRIDQGKAYLLSADLERCNVPVWIDKYHLRGGARWKDRIHDVITQECRFCILPLSSQSAGKRGYVNVEISTALEVLAEFPPGKIYLIPVRLDQCEPRHRQLRDLNWVDMFPDWDNGLEEILASLSHDPYLDLIVPQRVSWKPDLEGESGIEIKSHPGGFIEWTHLKAEIESKLLPSVRNLPPNCTISRGQFRGRENWIIRVFDKMGSELANIWFGGEPENGWRYDGLVRIGPAQKSPDFAVWQTWQRYSDGSYRRIKVHDGL